MKKRKLRKPRDLGSLGFIDSVNGVGQAVYIDHGSMHLNSKEAERLAKYLLKAAAWLKQQEDGK